MVYEKLFAGQSPAGKRKREKHMRTAERAVRFLITAIAAAGAFILLIPAWGIRADAVLSGSMEPALKTGSLVFTDTKKREPEAGDIVTYRLEDIYVTHRVIGKEDGGFVTKGDANEGSDEALVKEIQIVGTVLFSIPLLGYAAVFIQSRAVFSLILLVIFQEIFFLIIQWKGERREQSAEKRND